MSADDLIVVACHVIARREMTPYAALQAEGDTGICARVWLMLAAAHEAATDGGRPLVVEVVT